MVLFLAVSAAMAQEPEKPEISPDLMKTRLLQIHRKAVQARLDWWQGKLEAATTDEEVIEARKNIRRDYSRYLNDVYRDAYTEMATATLMPMLQGQGLDLSSRLGQIRQLNVAIVLAKMQYLPAMPALEYMVGSDNQALQYLGWQGLARLQQKIFAKGGKTAESYLALLGGAIKPETNPLVLRPILEGLAAKGMTLPKAMAAQATKTLLARIESIVPMLRKSIPSQQMGQPGDPVVFDLVEPAVLAVTNLAANLAANLPADAAAEKTRCLQLVYAIAQTAAREFDRASQDAPPDKASMSRMGDTLRVCESALNAMTGQKKQYIAEALQADVACGAAVQEAVIIKWLDDLKAMGVKQAPPVK